MKKILFLALNILLVAPLLAQENKSSNDSSIAFFDYFYPTTSLKVGEGNIYVYNYSYLSDGVYKVKDTKSFYFWQREDDTTYLLSIYRFNKDEGKYALDYIHPFIILDDSTYENDNIRLNVDNPIEKKYETGVHQGSTFPIQWNKKDTVTNSTSFPLPDSSNIQDKFMLLERDSTLNKEDSTYAELIKVKSLSSYYYYEKSKTGEIIPDGEWHRDMTAFYIKNKGLALTEITWTSPKEDDPFKSKLELVAIIPSAKWPKDWGWGKEYKEWLKEYEEKGE